MKLRTPAKIVIFSFVFYMLQLTVNAESSRVKELPPYFQNSQQYDVPSYSGFKSYMPYTLFNKTSDQYALQELCCTDSDGFRRYENCYVVALGNYFDAEVGQRFDLVLANNETIHCVLGDRKDDRDTDKNNLFTSANNCMSEFIIDSSQLDSTVKKMGDVSYLPSQDWNSPVVEVIIFNDNVLEN